MRMFAVYLALAVMLQWRAMGQTVFEDGPPQSPPSTQPTGPDAKAPTNNPIREQLTAARKAHQEASAKAREGLLSAFDDAMKAVAQAGDLDGVQALQAERKAFEEAGQLPTSARMRGSAAGYQRAVKQAAASLEQAYDQAVKDLTKALRIEEAEAVRAEWQQVQGGAVVQPVAAPAPSKPGPAGPFEYKFYEWKKGDAPVKMIHRDEGFCYLVGIHGALNGGGESVQITIENDGYWYLRGRSSNPQPLNVRAVSVKLLRK